MSPEELHGAYACDLCGEGFAPVDEVAEMFNNRLPGSETVLCHAQCGLDAGLVVA